MPINDSIYMGELTPSIKLAEEPLFVDTPYTSDDFFLRWYPSRREQLVNNMARMRAAKTEWPFGQKRRARKNVDGYTQSMLQNMEENLKEYSLVPSIWNSAYPYNSAYDPKRKWKFPDAVKDEEARMVLDKHIEAKNNLLKNHGINVDEEINDVKRRSEGWDAYGFSYSDDPNHIFYSSAWPSDDTIVHERTHTLRPIPGEYDKYRTWVNMTPMEYAVNRIEEFNDNLLSEAGKAKEDKSYYTSPKEIVARLNAIRFNLGLNPNHVITIDDLKEIRGKASKYDRENFLDLYTDEALLRFFNEVADAGPQESLYGNHLGNLSAYGGPIHIKPSHRGRLTELKERTGKTEAELYNDGNPAHKKMIVFARNSRKWHSDGGLLHKFDGGGKFMTVSSGYAPLMYTPSPEVRPDVPIPTKYVPQPDNGDYEYPSSTGMLENYPITTSFTSSPSGFVIADEVPGAAAQEVYNDEADKAAREERMWRQWYAESAFNNSAKSPAGARGAFQIMPITYKDYLGRGKGKPGDLNNPAYNRKVRDFVLGIIPRDLGAFWSDDSSDEINLAKRYAAYNWGAGSLRNYLRKKQKEGVDIHNSLAWLSGLPKETRDYVNFIVFNQDVPDTSKTQALYEAARRKYNGKSMGGVIEKLSKMYGNDRAAMLSALRKNRY